ncbi:MAG: hypothetical protein R3F34_02145 [Planctomycetota bacterium]
MSPRANAAIAAALALAAAWLSLWVGTPSGWGPFEAVGRLFGGDSSRARARAFEIALLALGAATQAAVVSLARAGAAASEAGGAFAASASGLARLAGLANPLVGALGVGGALLGHLGARARGDARRVAWVLLAPSAWLLWSLATVDGETRTFVPWSHGVFGDVWDARAPELMFAAAGAVVALAASFLADARTRAVLGTCAQGAAVAATGWFCGIGWLAARLLPGAGPVRTALTAALVVVLGEAGLAALTEPGRLPVAAVTGTLALIVAVAPFERS